jgi:uncharacterized glyoxalase superfamily protein PhnB
MTEVRAVPAGMHTVTPHIVVGDANAASEWYQQAFGAKERDRLPLPNDKVMYVELWFGDSPVMVADEFPDYGILSPLTIGGTAVVLHIFTEDVERAWQRAVDAGADVLVPSAGAVLGRPPGTAARPLRPRVGAGAARARSPA